MKNTRRRRGSIVAAMSLALVASTSGFASAATTSKPPKPKSEGYLGFVPSAVNNSGVLIGVEGLPYYDSRGGMGRVRYPRTGGVADLRVPAGSPYEVVTLPLDINDSGLIVGFLHGFDEGHGYEQVHPALWRTPSSEPELLPEPTPGRSWEAVDVTPSGRILLVDRSQELDHSVPRPPSYVDDDGVLTSVSELTHGALSWAEAVNDKGQFLGGTGEVGAATVLWDGVKVVPMQSTPGKPGVVVADLSEAGVLGGSVPSLVSNKSVPALWDATGALTTLALPADAVDGRVTDLSDSGDPVGTYVSAGESTSEDALEHVVGWRHNRVHTIGEAGHAHINDKDFVAAGISGGYRTESYGYYWDRHAW